MIQAEHIQFEYFRRDDDGNVTELVEAIKDVSMRIKSGEFVAILGRNGSGKSTFAKLVNALLTPSEGSLVIAGMDAADEDNIWKIRRQTGMVFQNPDNQIVGTVVEEDVAFGPENIGIPEDEMLTRVAASLEQVGMTAYRMSSPNRLSGGQKQRVAIAGVLAMHPRCIIFDESTAMLDPEGRAEVLRIAKELNDTEGITILYITHEMEEAAVADRICVLHEGALVMEGTPKQVFARQDELIQYGLALPKVTEIAVGIRSLGIDFQDNILDMDDFISEMNRVMAYKNADTIRNPRSMAGTVVEGETTAPEQWSGIAIGQDGDRAIRQVEDRPTEPGEDGTVEQGVDKHRAIADGLVCNHIYYDYQPNTVYSVHALMDVNLAISKGEFIALIGHTGSGKSTLVQHMNGLLAPTEGQIYYEGKDIYEKGYDRSYLRSKVGLVFQYPEHQLFADTVFNDVCFGPKNLKLPLLEVQQRAFEAIRLVGLSDDIYDLSPFELSGGQMRRVAIAGVLAMQPDILILDEPSAGLDPAGRKELFRILRALHEAGMTILFITHNMEEAAEYAERVLVMDQGRLIYDLPVEQIFTHEQELVELGLRTPVVTQLMQELKRNGYSVPTHLYRVEDAIQCITHYIKSV